MSVDPFVAQLQALLSAEESAAKGQRQQNVRKAFIDFGGDFGAVPGFDPGFFSQDIDASTLALAQQNTAGGTSQLAQLQRQFDDAQRQLGNDLAARGMLDSGENPFGQERLAQGRKQSLYDTSSKILEYLSGQYAGFQQGVVERNQRLMQGTQDAELRRQQREHEQRQLALQQQALAQELQIAQQQMAMQMAQINAENAAAQAAFAGGGGGDMGGGGEAPAGGGSTGKPTITQWQADKMVQWGSTQGYNRPPNIQAIFQAHPGYLADPSSYEIVPGAGAG